MAGVLDGEHCQPVRANSEHAQGPEGSEAPHQGRAGTRTPPCSPTRLCVGHQGTRNSPSPGPSILEGPLDKCF